jgi:hypothetical protein
MKPLEADKVEQLLEVLQKKPGQRIVHFTASSHILTKYLHRFCQTHNNDYYLYCTKDVFYDKSMTKYAGQSNIQIAKFNLHRPRYILKATEFDYLITTVDLTEEDKGKFLGKCYPILKTGGNIIIILPNSGYTERDEWRDILQEQYYGSVNIIDDLFEHYDVIIAKRMHGKKN